MIWMSLASRLRSSPLRSPASLRSWSLPRARARWLAGAAALGGALLVACTPPVSIEAVREQQAAGDFAGSIEPLRALVSQNPDDPELNFLYGRALFHSGQPSLATWALREAMSDPEWRVPAGLEIARAGLTNTDFNEVVDATTAILEEEPDHALALLYRAQALAHWKTDPEAALADAERVLELEPEMLEAYEPRILALVALDRLPEASEALEEVGTSLSATDAAASTLAWHCSTTAILATDLGEHERAREKWNECAESYPTDAFVVVNAVKFFDAAGDWGRSIEILRAGLEEVPDHRPFRTALADRLARTGSPAEGESILRKATEVEDPRLAAAAWSDLALYRHSLLEHAAAAEALERSIERIREVENPNPQLLFRHADALLVSGQLDRALEVAGEIGVPAQRLLIEGRVAQERGQPARALERFDEALRLWPDNPWARYYAALAAEQLGNFDRALEEYRYSIRISVGATDARTRAARLLLAQGQPGLAYQLIFLDIANAPLDPEGELLSVFLIARVANPKQLQNELSNLAAKNPARIYEALAEAGRGARLVAGPQAALSLMVSAPGIDYTSPAAEPPLRQIVTLAHAAGRREVGAELLETARAARPKAAAFRELQGFDHELAGEFAEAQAAYEEALSLDPAQAQALAGLGRLALADDPAAARSYFDRALALAPDDADAQLGAARALRASGQVDAAHRRLDALLAAHPLEAQAALEQASIDLAREAVDERTLERAIRAVRLGAGVPAYQALREVYARLGRAEDVAETDRRLELLRERLGKQDELGRPKPGAPHG